MNKINDNPAFKLLSRSQSDRPQQIFDVLLSTAVRESWIVVLVNLHMSIFFGILLLSSGYGEKVSLLFLAMHISCTLFATALFFHLLRQPPQKILQNPKRAMNLLSIGDAGIALGWGLSMTLLLSTDNFSNTNTLIALLIAAGIASAALSAKLIRVLVLGRLLVFMPAILYLLWQQPPSWGLYSGSLAVGIAISIGVGYFIHIQLLREAALVVELRETQQQIIDAAEFRERFLKSITHDLRQPLASIGLFSRHLLKKNTTEQTELKAIRACLNSANDILDSVAHLAWVNNKLPRPTLQTLAIDTVLAPIIAEAEPVAREKGLQLRYHPSQRHCVAEAHYLQRMVRNLLQNAIQNTQQGGILVGVRNRASQGEVEVQVLDTGAGVARQDWQKIFQQYQRLDQAVDTHSGHLGLGLSIVNSIAEALGARITLASTVGQGSCFGIVLPQAASAKTTNNMATSTETISTAAINNGLLIVDDDPQYAAQIQQVANSLSINCHLVTTTAELATLADQGLPEFDYYVVDFELGENLSGLDLLQSTAHKQRAVLISKRNFPERLAQVQEHGICFAEKPLTEAAIRGLLRELTTKQAVQTKL